MKRLLWTLLAIPAGVAVGFVLMLPVVGAPHAFPGLLLHAPDELRNRVSLGIVIATPILFVVLLWLGPIRRLLRGRTDETQ